MADDFFSFDKALEKLSLDEEDLKRLISAGEIRAFRDGSKMRLRADDVTRVAQDLGVGGQVGEEDASEVLEVEEVLFSETADDEGMVTTQLSEEETLLDDDLEVVEMEEESERPRARQARTAARGGARAAQQEETVESGGVRAAALLTTVVMLYGLAFVISMAASSSNSLTKPVVDMFGGGQ